MFRRLAGVDSSFELLWFPSARPNQDDLMFPLRRMQACGGKGRPWCDKVAGSDSDECPENVSIYALLSMDIRTPNHICFPVKAVGIHVVEYP